MTPPLGSKCKTTRYGVMNPFGTKVVVRIPGLLEYVSYEITVDSVATTGYAGSMKIDKDTGEWQIVVPVSPMALADCSKPVLIDTTSADSESSPFADDFSLILTFPLVSCLQSLRLNNTKSTLLTRRGCRVTARTQSAPPIRDQRNQLKKRITILPFPSLSHSHKAKSKHPTRWYE